MWDFQQNLKQYRIIQHPSDKSVKKQVQTFKASMDTEKCKVTFPVETYNKFTKTRNKCGEQWETFGDQEDRAKALKIKGTWA